MNSVSKVGLRPLDQQAVKNRAIILQEGELCGAAVITGEVPKLWFGLNAKVSGCEQTCDYAALILWSSQANLVLLIFGVKRVEPAANLVHRVSFTTEAAREPGRRD